jgi:hypothetical protein
VPVRPRQPPLATLRWTKGCSAERPGELVGTDGRGLGPISAVLAGTPDYMQYFPLSIIRAPHHPLAAVLERHTQDIVRLLLLDRSTRSLKPDFVQEELARDYCTREGGLTLLSRRSGLDLHGSEDVFDPQADDVLPPHSALPFLITLELLVIERAVLQRLYERLSHATHLSIEALLALKQEALDGLEEYLGAITAATRFSDAVAADGERLLGIVDLYDAVMDRLEAVSFAITTRYQKRMTLLRSGLPRCSVQLGSAGWPLASPPGITRRSLARCSPGRWVRPWSPCS